METWTRDEHGAWRRWSHPGLALEALANPAAPRMVSLLVVGTGPDDDEQLFAAVRLARRLATGPLQVVAATAHPSAPWRESVRAAGADLALLVSRPKTGRSSKEPPLEHVVELGGGTCPALHAKREREITLSVCGRHADRLVLARHHVERWCLAKQQDCPHWGRARG